MSNSKKAWLQGMLAAQSEISFDYPPNLVRVSSGQNYQGSEGAFGAAGAIANGGAVSGSLHWLYDDTGALDWTRYFSSGKAISNHAYFAEHDGHYYGVQYAYQDFAVFKLTAAGAVSWAKTGSHEITTNHTIYHTYIEVDAGGLGVGVIGVGDYSVNNDFFMVTLWDHDGNLLFQNKIYWSGNVVNGGGFSIQVTDDAVYVAVSTYGAGNSVTIIKFNSAGVKQWAYDYAYSSGASASPEFSGQISISNGFLYAALSRGVDNGLTTILKISAGDGILSWSRYFTASTGVTTGYGFTSGRLDVNRNGIFYASEYQLGSGADRRVNVCLFDLDMTSVQFTADVRITGRNLKLGQRIQIWNNGCGLFVDRGASLSSEGSMLTSDFAGGCPAFTTSIAASDQAFGADVFTRAVSSVLYVTETPTTGSETPTYPTTTAPTISTTW